MIKRSRQNFNITSKKWIKDLIWLIIPSIILVLVSPCFNASKVDIIEKENSVLSSSAKILNNRESSSLILTNNDATKKNSNIIELETHPKNLSAQDALESFSADGKITSFKRLEQYVEFIDLPAEAFIFEKSMTSSNYLGEIYLLFEVDKYYHESVLVNESKLFDVIISDFENIKNTVISPRIGNSFTESAQFAFESFSNGKEIKAPKLFEKYVNLYNTPEDIKLTIKPDYFYDNSKGVVFLTIELSQWYDYGYLNVKTPKDFAIFITGFENKKNSNITLTKEEVNISKTSAKKAMESFSNGITVTDEQELKKYAKIEDVDTVGEFGSTYKKISYDNKLGIITIEKQVPEYYEYGHIYKKPKTFTLVIDGFIPDTQILKTSYTSQLFTARQVYDGFAKDGEIIDWVLFDKYISVKSIPEGAKLTINPNSIIDNDKGRLLIYINTNKFYNDGDLHDVSELKTYTISIDGFRVVSLNWMIWIVAGIAGLLLIASAIIIALYFSNRRKFVKSMGTYLGELTTKN